MGKPLTPCTPRTPSTPSNAPTIYNTARQLFVTSADPGRLIGREEERNRLNSFLQEGIQSKSGRCLYVSGPPGTGKSALVTEVCHELKGAPDVRTAYINCMSVKSSKDIYTKLAEDLIDDGTDLEEDEEMVHLRKILLSKKSSGLVYVVTLDEIDHLQTLDLEILYTLFEWSLHRSSHLILIGIANALDLTDRFLPRLKARNLKPKFLPFLPYTAPQIASVISSKLKSLSPAQTSSQDHTPFVHPTAIQLCSKKVASQTGDLRKAFDIIRRTIDLVEIETKQKHRLDFKSLESTPSKHTSKTPLSENPNLSSTSQCLIDPTASLSLLSPLTAPRATVAHIARVSASALSNGTSQRLQILNLQQKAALCALISLQKTSCQAQSAFETPTKPSSMSMVPTVRKLYKIYHGLCKRENGLHPLTATEFMDVIGGLETLGLLGNEDGRGFARTASEKKGGKGEERMIVSWVSESEVERCLDGVGGDILRGLLRGGE